MNKRNVGIGLLLAFGLMTLIQFIGLLSMVNRTVVLTMTSYHWVMTIGMVALFVTGIVLVLRSE